MKKPVALVLSSGGSKGLAQIGVINELEKQDFQIREKGLLWQWVLNRQVMKLLFFAMLIYPIYEVNIFCN
jgi:hypothetical protein